MNIILSYSVPTGLGLVIVAARVSLARRGAALSQAARRPGPGPRGVALSRGARAVNGAAVAVWLAGVALAGVGWARPELRGGVGGWLLLAALSLALAVVVALVVAVHVVPVGADRVLSRLLLRSRCSAYGCGARPRPGAAFCPEHAEGAPALADLVAPPAPAPVPAPVPAPAPAGPAVFTAARPAVLVGTCESCGLRPAGVLVPSGSPARPFRVCESCAPVPAPAAPAAAAVAGGSR